MSRYHLLVVEDDEAIQELMVYNLSKEGFRITALSRGEDALRKMRTEAFHCVLLDLMLPGIDGLEVCRTMKTDVALQALPVIMVTAKGEEADIVTGLELGADDYVVKPFSPRVLVARVKSVLRRRANVLLEDDQPLAVGGITIDPSRHEVCFDGRTVDLTNLEFRVLQFLAGRPGRVFTRYQIVNGVRGDNYPVTDRAVDVLIVGIRKKLGAAGHCIETVRGVGYRFKEER